VKRWMMWGCGLLIVATIVLAVTGAASAAWIPVAGCALMMGLMAWMMIRMGGGGGD
jgi:hypothetical protein